MGVSDDEVFYKGQGCQHCNHTGFSGRLAVYELLKIDVSMHSLIQEHAAIEKIRTQAIKSGMVPLTQNALDQARQHNTSLAEAYRVRLE